MAIQIVLFITLLAYSFIVSQSFMYILALKDVQLKMDGRTYTTFRHLIDANMRNTFKYPIYIVLLANLALVILTLKNPGSLLFITATIAFFAVMMDTLLTVKRSLPVNDVINQWSPDNYPPDWEQYRQKWLDIFQYRQALNIFGFVSLLAGCVFRAGC